MAWDALREQIETPPVIGRRDERSIRVKAYIESQLADPELSVERIAHACSISVRGLHRLFAEDPAGSVSSYLWCVGSFAARRRFETRARRIAR